jgi:hypothetical protein
MSRLLLWDTPAPSRLVACIRSPVGVLCVAHVDNLLRASISASGFAPSCHHDGAPFEGERQQPSRVQRRRRLSLLPRTQRVGRW